MSLIDGNAILDLTLDRSRDLVEVAAFDGGWEGWAQVELGVICSNSNLWFEREQACYSHSTSSKADFVFRNPLTVMELKCKLASETAIIFAAKLVADVKKLHNLKLDYWDNWNNKAGVGVVGLYPPKEGGAHDVDTENAVRNFLKAKLAGHTISHYKYPIEIYHTVRFNSNIGIWWLWANIR